MRTLALLLLAASAGTRAEAQSSIKSTCRLSPEIAARSYSVTLTPMQGEPTSKTFKYLGCHEGAADGGPDNSIYVFAGVDAMLAIVVFDATPAGPFAGKAGLLFYDPVHPNPDEKMGLLDPTKLLGSVPIDLGDVDIVGVGRGRGFLNGWDRP